MTKRFLRGKATSVAYVQLLIRNGLFKQLPLPSVPYEQFMPIVDRDVLSEALGRDVSFARTIANVIYVPSDLARDWTGGVQGLAQMQEMYPDLLEAQFITPTFVRRLKKGEVRQALSSRASAIRVAVLQ